MPLNDKQIRDALLDCKAFASTQLMHLEVINQMIHAAFRGPDMTPGTVRALTATLDHITKIAIPASETAITRFSDILDELDAPAVRPVD